MAAVFQEGGDLKMLINGIESLIASVIPIAVGLCLLGFLWGVFLAFFGDAENAEKRAGGYKFIMWSLLALFVVVSLGGIIGVLESTLFGTSP